MQELCIGMIGNRGDSQLGSLGRALERRGARPVPFDLTDIPAHVNFHWERGALRFGDIDLATLAAVYVRTGHFPMPLKAPGLEPEKAERLVFPLRETGSLCNALVGELADHMPVVNPPGSHRFHHMKPLMYATLQRAGVPVPEFAVGCDLEQAARFVDRLGEEVVVKPLMGGEVFVADLDYLREHHQEVDRRPLLLQRRIRGRSLRVYLVDGRVVASAEVVHGDVIDWRSDVQQVRPVDLPERAALAAVKAVGALGLVFASLDIEEEAGDGDRPWVLDVNPGPMFAGFEQLSGLDVAGPLAEALLMRARGEQTLTEREASS